MVKTTSQADTIDMAAIEAELSHWTSDKLKIHYLECFRGAALYVARCAWCIKLLRDRDEDVSGYRNVGIMLRIAEGQVLPELYWRFIESPCRTQVARLPLSDQRRLAADPTVEVAEGKTVRKVDLSGAPAEIGRQCIGDSIRSPEEQRAFLAQQKLRAAARPATQPSEPIAEPLTRSVSVKLTEAEHRGLTINAARLGLTTAMLARRGLVRSRVLEEGHA